MKTRLSATTALAVIAALTVSSEAFAQARSDRNIPVRKGETPMPARTDTVVVRDTIRVQLPPDTVRMTIRDTVIQRVEVAPPPTPFGTFYWGLQGGADIPVQTMNIPHSPGFTVGALLGWDSFRAPLGLRLDGGYSRIGEESAWAGGGGPGTGGDPNGVGDPELWYVNGDVKVRLPFMADSPVKLYAVGGITYNRFRGFTFVDEDANNAIILQTDRWSDKWGGNLGGGIAFGFGRANLFIESRYQTMNIGNTTQNHVPVVLGITF